mgnify:CR=1 FL=1
MIPSNLHPCPACGLNAPRAIDASHSLCDTCAADLPATLAHVNEMLTAATAGHEQQQARWIETQTALPDALAQRWAALCAARNAAEGAVAAYERGRLSAALPDNDRRMRLQTAYQRLAHVQHKIERTRVNVPELAVLLDKESRHLAEVARLQQEIQRWSIAKQETEWAIAGERPF